MGNPNRRPKPEPVAIKRRFRVLVGINYPDPLNGGEKRAEAGEVVDDVPASAIDHLVETGVLTEVHE